MCARKRACDVCEREEGGLRESGREEGREGGRVGGEKRKEEVCVVGEVVGKHHVGPSAPASPAAASQRPARCMCALVCATAHIRVRQRVRGFAGTWRQRGGEAAGEKEEK